ncbi:MAG: hypothetical protein PWP48_1789 [Clostridiales bacterium]|jgi:hypothetical protein|nr:hypothetical protein [Clostridiales bacterium]MDK2992556.1 hypothetical protein [Clostridiales bacterium]
MSITEAILGHKASKVAYFMNGGITVEIGYSGLTERG